jgi:hypothetical protein
MTYGLNAVTSIGAGYANIFPGTFLKNAYTRQAISLALFDGYLFFLKLEVQDL